jgi:hypothetical protein
MKLWLAVGMLRDSESWSIRAVARVQYLSIVSFENPWQLS